MLALVGCSSDTQTGGQTNAMKIAIGSKDYTENMLCAEIMARLLEENLGATVERNHNMAPTVVWESMKNGFLQLCPEFTSTILMDYFKMGRIDDPVQCYAFLSEKLKTDYQMTYLPSFGFKNDYAIAVSRKLSEEKNLTKVSDLIPVANELVFGAEHNYFTRPDGFDNVQKIYGWEFKDLKKVTVSLKYQAAGQGDIDVILVFTTDAAIYQEDLVVLEDDKHAFVTYYCGPLIRDDIIAEHPEFKMELEKLAGKIDEAKMRQLNAKVDIEGKTLTEVADEFLIDAGLVIK